MKINVISMAVTCFLVGLAPSWADTLGTGTPLVSEAATGGAMIVVGAETFYDPDQGAAFDTAPSGAFLNDLNAVPEISYSPEGYMISAETINGVRYETVTDLAGRVIEARQVAPVE